jgi:D-sedoheptulose 7-phosphate isomerase
MKFIKSFFKEVIEVIHLIDKKKILELVLLIKKYSKGRIFFLGVGGSAANASHAVNDFRKITGIECYTPVDNISELTARTNDEGWEYVFSKWLITSKVNKNDLIFVFSVGGGDEKKNISKNIVNALKIAKKKKCKIAGVVGANGGFTAKVADVCIKIPFVNQKHITPHSESFQSIIWHLLVSHPLLKKYKTKW